MKLSEDLKGLVDSSIIDGEISSKERKVILKRALNEGHDQNEFELYLDGLIQKDKIEQKGTILAFFILLFTKPKRLFLIVVLPSIIIFLLTTDMFMSPDAKELKDLNIKIEKLVDKQNLNCSTIDNCISIYNFEAARSIADLAYQSSEREGVKVFQKVINAEAIYWVNDNDYDRAYNVIVEGKDYFVKYRSWDRGLYYGSMLNVITKIVDQLLIINDFNTAKKWVLKLPDAVYDDYYQIIYLEGSSDYDPNKTMSKVLIERINEMEKLSK